MPSSIAYKIEELEKELKQVNAKKEKLEKELRELKKDQQRVNRHRRRRNLPAELKVEIVDCLPVENAVHFLANVPNRLIIHHCAPRIRRMLKMIDQIVIGYARTLPAPNSVGSIWLMNGHQYSPEMEIFFRYGVAHCNWFIISRGTGDGFTGYPADFFDDLLMYYYETKVPAKTIRYLMIDLSLTNPAPWPAVLVQPQAGEMNVKEVRNAKNYVKYILRNKHNPSIAFLLYIHFESNAKCYQQMIRFVMGKGFTNE